MSRISPAIVATIAALRDETSELRCARVQALMLKEGLDNQLACRLDGGDVRKEQFLFFAKVRYGGGNEEAPRTP